MKESRNRVTLVLGRRRIDTEAMKKAWWRGFVEVAFIIFLFYSNLLMGEFEHSGAASAKGLWWALWDVVTPVNFCIATIAGVFGYLLFEFLRKTS